MTTQTAPSMPIESAPAPSVAAPAASWAWLAPYMVIIFVLMLLGSLLGDLTLFKRATLGTAKLTASQLVKLFSYGGALLMVWLIAQRSTLQLRVQGGKTGFLGSIVVAAAGALDNDIVRAISKAGNLATGGADHTIGVLDRGAAVYDCPQGGNLSLTSSNGYACTLTVAATCPPGFSFLGGHCKKIYPANMLTAAFCRFLP
ncbi:MAG: hypothetical protein EXR36_05785 [Betaproteobacteria bacterium]|nr:hypothetical protein [Betaproteobacteria bacterium]